MFFFKIIMNCKKYIENLFLKIMLKFMFEFIIVVFYKLEVFYLFNNLK